MSRARLIAFMLVIGFAGVLTFLALRSSSYLQFLPWMPRPVGVWADNHGVFRNTVAFFALGLCTFALLGRTLWHVTALCVFGTLIEVAQIWIPSRAFDWKDIAASVAGILAAWPVAFIGAIAWRRRSP
jgi:hypothetical protein